MPRRHGLFFAWTIASAGCLLATGCVTVEETTLADGSKFTTKHYAWEAPLHRKAKASSQLNLAYARLQEQRGNEQEARQSYEKVLAENPRSVDAMVGLAKLDQLAGRTDTAEAKLMEALRLEPKSPVVLTALGAYYSDQKRFQEAIGAMQQAVQIAPEDKTCRYQLGMVLARAQRTDDALAVLSQSVGPAAAHYNLGLVLHEQNDLQGAEYQFAQALMKDPHLTQAQVWLDEIRQQQTDSGTQLAGGAAGQGVGGGGLGGPGTRSGGRTEPFGETAITPGGSPAAPTLASNAHQLSFMPRVQEEFKPTGGPGSGMAHSGTGAPAQRAVGHSLGANPGALGAGGVKPASASAPVAGATAPAGTPPAATMPRTSAAGGAAPAGMTPQQWEQWANQRAGT